MATNSALDMGFSLGRGSGKNRNGVSVAGGRVRADQDEDSGRHRARPMATQTRLKFGPKMGLRGQKNDVGPFASTR